MDIYEQTLREAADAGTAILMKYFRALPEVRTKAKDYDLITQADLECERVVIDTIRHRFPDHVFLAEESENDLEAARNAEWTWIVDPLDGTTNFAHSLPWFGLSLGLWHNGEMLLGLVANPAQKDLYFARRGHGATRNGRPIQVGPETDLSQMLVVTGFPYDKRERSDYYLKQVQHMLLTTRGVRRMGAASVDMCYVADGSFGVYWESSLHPWDWAPGALIVQEAGGRVTDLEGAEFTLGQTSCVATNGVLHAKALALLNAG